MSHISVQSSKWQTAIKTVYKFSYSSGMSGGECKCYKGTTEPALFRGVEISPIYLMESVLLYSLELFRRIYSEVVMLLLFEVKLPRVQQHYHLL